jgi:hypothetical protein
MHVDRVGVQHRVCDEAVGLMPDGLAVLKPGATEQ